MSREKSIVPTNLLDWPRVAPLLPEQKLILLWLWASPYMRTCGCGVVPSRPAAATLQLGYEAVQTGLKNLRDAGLINYDDQTEEVFILDWFRFHTFKTDKSQAILFSEIEKTINPAIKNVILEKTRTYLLTVSGSTTLKDTTKNLVGNSPSANSDDALQHKSTKGKSQVKGMFSNPSGDLTNTPPVAGVPPAGGAWQVYADAMEERYGLRIDQTPADGKMIKNLVQAAGDDTAAELIKIYLACNDKFYVESLHKLSLLVRNITTFKIKLHQSKNGVKQANGSREAVKLIVQNGYNNLSKQDFRAGVDANGRLIM
ncbi:MAG: hypothetical protein Q8K61_08810 [Gallionella sp.]|nr:hypothetical protein [Gallionella sp.]